MLRYYMKIDKNICQSPNRAKSHVLLFPRAMIHPFKCSHNKVVQGYRVIMGAFMYYVIVSGCDVLPEQWTLKAVYLVEPLITAEG